MANTSSAKKAIRVSLRKKHVNSKKVKSFKSAKKEVMDLVKAGNTKDAEKKLSVAYTKIDKAAKDNTIHKNTAARYKSRLAQALKKIKN